MKTLARDLAKVAREWLSGDGYNVQNDVTGAMVDGKPLYFLENWKLDGQGNKVEMVSSRSFKKVTLLLAADGA
jgi:hypothetical protein